VVGCIIKFEEMEQIWFEYYGPKCKIYIKKIEDFVPRKITRKERKTIKKRFALYQFLGKKGIKLPHNITGIFKRSNK